MLPYSFGKRLLNVGLDWWLTWSTFSYMIWQNTYCVTCIHKWDLKWKCLGILLETSYLMSGKWCARFGNSWQNLFLWNQLQCRSFHQWGSICRLRLQNKCARSASRNSEYWKSEIFCKRDPRKRFSSTICDQIWSSCKSFRK